MSDLGNIFGRFAGKLANGLNTDRSLKCLGKCGGKITKHIAVSNGEYRVSKNTMDTIAGILGTVNDYNPLYPLSVGNLYACSECNKIRLHGGMFSERINENMDTDYLLGLTQNRKFD